MIDTFFQEINKELQSALTTKGHPFKYFTLATTGEENNARLRTVVLRNVSSDLVLTFYTDGRSKKVGHILDHNQVSLLFYDPTKLLQLTIEGVARINTDQKIKQELWKDVPTKSHKAYTTTDAPGSGIQNPDDIEYLKDKDFFTVIHVEARKVEYLKLNEPQHLRVAFQKEDGMWIGQYLVP